MPWPFKLAIISAATLRAFPEDRDARPLDQSELRACFWLMCLFTITVTMPSIFFSVRFRPHTTNFISQSMLMLCVIGATMCRVMSREDEWSMYGCLVMLVLSTHYFYGMYRAVLRTEKLLNYNYAVQVAAATAGVVVAGWLGWRLPAFRMLNYTTPVLLFSGELMGVLVFVADELFRSIADGVEDFCA